MDFSFLIGLLQYCQANIITINTLSVIFQITISGEYICISLGPRGWLDYWLGLLATLGVKAVAVWGGSRTAVGRIIWISFAAANIATCYCFISSMAHLQSAFYSVLLSPLPWHSFHKASDYCHLAYIKALNFSLDHVHLNPMGGICLIDNAHQLVWGFPASQLAFDTVVTVLILYKGWLHRNLTSTSRPSIVGHFPPGRCILVCS
jgi:hypothetical protein